VHGPTTGLYNHRLPPKFFLPFSSFFFILTLIECREIKKTLHYSGEPALHAVVLAAMNCPSGPFRSEFLITNSFSLCAWLQSGHGEEELVIVIQSTECIQACTVMFFAPCLFVLVKCTPAQRVMDIGMCNVPTASGVVSFPESRCRRVAEHWKGVLLEQ